MLREKITTGSPHWHIFFAISSRQRTICMLCKLTACRPAITSQSNASSDVIWREPQMHRQLNGPLCCGETNRSHVVQLFVKQFNKYVICFHRSTALYPTGKKASLFSGRSKFFFVFAFCTESYLLLENPTNSCLLLSR